MIWHLALLSSTERERSNALAPVMATPIRLLHGLSAMEKSTLHSLVVQRPEDSWTICGGADMMMTSNCF